MQKSVLSLSTYAKSNKRVIQTNNLYILSSCDYHQRHYSHLLRANAQDDGNGKFFSVLSFYSDVHKTQSNRSHGHRHKDTHVIRITSRHGNVAPKTYAFKINHGSKTGFAKHTSDFSTKEKEK